MPTPDEPSGRYSIGSRRCEDGVCHPDGGTLGGPHTTWFTPHPSKRTRDEPTADTGHRSRHRGDDGRPAAAQDARADGPVRPGRGPGRDGGGPGGRARGTPGGPASGPRPDVRAGDLDGGRSPPPRAPLLPAHPRGHRGREGPRAPAHLRLQAGRHRHDLPRSAVGQGRGGRRGQAGGRCHRERGRPRQQGPLPPAARGRDRSRRPRRRRRRCGPGRPAPSASIRMPRTCSTSTTAR